MHDYVMVSLVNQTAPTSVLDVLHHQHEEGDAIHPALRWEWSGSRDYVMVWTDVSLEECLHLLLRKKCKTEQNFCNNQEMLLYPV